MKKKLLTALLAAVLCTPQVAFAARDGDGMEYTSASEGFYGSIRTVYRSKSGSDDANPDKNNGGIISADGSRLGVRGTHDLGHGMTGLYRYEWSVSGDNGTAVGNTRLSYVGLRGSFGEFVAGSHWENDYNWVTAATDIATTGSGNFAPHFRRANSFQYTTPDLDGFQGSFRFTADGKNKRTGGTEEVLVVTDTGAMRIANITNNRLTLKSPSENIDEWAIAARFRSHGFTFAGSYEVQPDALRSINVTHNTASVNDDNHDATRGKKDDATFWAVRLGYGQDNWDINAWYGEHNTSDRRVVVTADNDGANAVNADDLVAVDHQKPKDTKIFSIGGDLDIGKIGLVAIFEQRKQAKKDSVFIFNADYYFTSQTRAYVAYIANDFDTNKDKDDELRIGMRLDF